jgi:hypothetical protein
LDGLRRLWRGNSFFNRPLKDDIERVMPIGIQFAAIGQRLVGMANMQIFHPVAFFIGVTV